MSTPFQPFLIGELKSGINTYLAPWRRAVDAFNPLINAFVYRGTLRKRFGTSVFGNQLSDASAVMGIITRIDESTGVASLLACSKKYAYLYNAGTDTFDALLSVGGASSVFWQGTATGSISVPTFWPGLVPTSIIIFDGVTSIADNGAGGLSAGGIFAAGGTINYATGQVNLNFTGSTPNKSLTITASLVPPSGGTGYFTGLINNFFNSTNWQPTDPTTFVNSVSYLYMTNGVDPITLFDGTLLSRPIFYVNSTKTDYITTALDVTIYKSRLLFFKPTLNSTSNALNQSVYYSALFNPIDVINDIAGHGGQITAATGDIIISEDPLRDDLVVNFTNSTWLLRSTGIAFAPFRFDTINKTKTNNSSYGSVSYDDRTTSIGSKGLTSCDGVNVSRYDTSIIDYYETQIQQQYFSQCFSQRYDNKNQTWILYCSVNEPYSVIDDIAPGSDEALIYNFLEDSWATFTFQYPMTCLGTFNNVKGTTWASLMQSWDVTPLTWHAYSNQRTAQTVLGGDVDGNIYNLDDATTVTEAGKTISIDVVSTRWNPLIETGQRVQFGHIDIYYVIPKSEIDDPIQVTLYFYFNNSESQSTALKRTLTLDGPANGQYNWKRIYINIVGEFVQMEIDPNKNAYMEFLGFILWVRPSGRLTPGLTQA